MESQRHSAAGQEVVFRGIPGFHLGLRMVDYEYPDDTSGPDADWIEGSLEVRVGQGPEARVATQVSWRAEELASFAKELEDLVRRGSGKAELEHLECLVGLTIEMAQELRLSGRVGDQTHLEFGFRQVQMTWDDLIQASQSLSSVVARLPTRE